MFYNNESKNAVLAMEYARTGGYGGDADRYSCPCCGAVEPDAFYVNDNDDCVGCTDCVFVSDMPWG